MRHRQPETRPSDGGNAEGPRLAHGSVADAAVAYAARGWPVLPLRPGGKAPLIARAEGGHGVHDATIDPDRIRAWWAAHPAANVGLAAGAAFWALDVDYQGWEATEPDGLTSLNLLVERFGPLPPP
jgi:Bifunctional DNA primase/polymerase, N-terminal